jgi:small-conductance mechanosensitive channel
LDQAGIEIPFPHMQLFIEKTKGLQVLAAGKGAAN